MSLQSRSKEEAIESFWKRVNKTETCWLWMGAIHVTGYGAMKFSGRKSPLYLTHRLSYKITYGPIPNGLCVMHSCDNRLCVNPDHLSLGTRADNMRDMINKNRAVHRTVDTKGRSWRILNEDAVKEIRANRYLVSMTTLANKYGVTKYCIYDVMRRRTWDLPHL